MTNAKILIVQDEHSAPALDERLKDLGYTVCAAVSSKQQAIEEAQGARPDLALIDLELGEGLQGIEAAEQIGSRFDIPVIYLTDDAESHLLQRPRPPPSPRLSAETVRRTTTAPEHPDRPGLA